MSSLAAFIPGHDISGPPPELVLLARHVIKTAIYDALPHVAKMFARSKPKSIREDRPALELQADALEFLSGHGDPDLEF